MVEHKDLEQILASVEAAKEQAGREMRQLLATKTQEVTERVPVERIRRHSSDPTYFGIEDAMLTSVLLNNKVTGSSIFYEEDHAILRKDGRLYHFSASFRRDPLNERIWDCQRNVGEELTPKEYFQVGPRFIQVLDKLVTGEPFYHI